MANRRMLSKSISVSKQVNCLSDRAALLFTWMIPHADDWGRMKADPSVIRALVVPMRRGFSGKVVEVCLGQIASAGLIRLYSVNGENFLFFPHWDQHQGALTTARRTDSSFPDPPTVALQCNEVPCQPNLTKPNLTKPSMRPAEAVATRSANALAMKECSWCKVPQKRNGPIQELLGYYHDRYLEKTGRCPKQFEGAGSKAFSNLLKDTDENDIRAAIVNLFESTDDYTVQRQYPITKLNGPDFNTLVEHPIHAPSRGKAAERKSTW